ncbi:hypothetical protein GINT2_001649 [Glugoides intestinalis]
METSEGFTFKRKTSNRHASIVTGRVEVQITDKRHNTSNDFVFNRVRANTYVYPQRAEGKAQMQETKSKTQGEKIPVATKKAVKANKKKEKDIIADASAIQFNILKKRKTIRLDNNIDISSDSILIDMPKGNYLEEPICMVLPTFKEKIKSHDIYKSVSANNINELIRQCIVFLNDKSKYADEVVKHCSANYFSDIDYRKEIENTNNKIEQIRNEITKWEGIFENKKQTNTLEIESIEYPKLECNLDKTAVIVEFEEKAARLRMLDDKLKYFFEHAKEKSETLLKNIFGTLGEKNVDALFLLKAMSKLGR